MNLHTAVARHTRVGIALVLLLLAACGAPDRVQPAGQAQPTVTMPATTKASANRPTSADGKLPPNAKRIATTVVGAVVAGGDYLFWRDTRNPLPEQRSIYGYDLHTQTEFLVTDAPAQYGPLASDGSLVVWVAHPAGSFSTFVQAYDLRTRQVFSLRENPAQIGFGGVAIGGGVLYYVDSAPHHVGLYAYTLATQQEVLVSANGRDPVVADGVLLWSEAVSTGSGTTYQESWSLHMWQVTPGEVTDLVLARALGQGGFSGYRVSGNYVVWATSPGSGEAKTYLYDQQKQQSQLISSDDFRTFYPTMNEQLLAWAAVPNKSTPQVSWSIQIYDLQQHTIATVLDRMDAQVKTWAIVKRTMLAFTVGISDLYLLHLS